jgi:hypothetical protein
MISIAYGHPGVEKPSLVLPSGVLAAKYPDFRGLSEVRPQKPRYVVGFSHVVTI